MRGSSGRRGSSRMACGSRATSGRASRDSRASQTCLYKRLRSYFLFFRAQIDDLRRLREGKVPHAGDACVAFDTSLSTVCHTTTIPARLFSFARGLILWRMICAARDPFRLSSGATVPSSHLTNLRALLKSPHALEVLQALRQAGEEVSVRCARSNSSHEQAQTTAARRT